MREKQQQHKQQPGSKPPDGIIHAVPHFRPFFHGSIAAESGSGVGVTKTSKWLS